MSSRAAAEPDAEAIAAAVTSCAGVAEVRSDLMRPIATYLPGRRVDGVRVEDDRVEVAVVIRAGVSVASVAERIRAILGGTLGPRRLDLVVTDVRLPEDEAADPA